MSGGVDSVGTLLAAIADLLSEGLRILSFADKRHWGADEDELVGALEAVLDEAKGDFQELSPLVNGQANYETDRKYESVEELKALRIRFAAHIQDLKDWSRSGGPVNPAWIRETLSLQKELHRAQCRAARRVFTSGQESSARCLGAFLVHRAQQAWSNNRVGVEEGEYQRRYLDELMVSNATGGFERFGDQDVAFVCDFCDGHLVWEDLERMPAMRSAQEGAMTPISPVSPTTRSPHWQASGLTMSGAEQKRIVFAPVAIANHAPPPPGDWQARLLCPFCEEDAQQPQEAGDDEDVYRPDHEFEDVAALQEHLEWQHTAAPTAVPFPVANLAAPEKCQVM